MSLLMLCKEENIQRLNIDPILIPAFKNVIRKLHAFFKENDYYQLHDYDSMLQTYLLNEDEHAYQINVSDQLKPSYGGLYTPKRSTNPGSITIAQRLCEGVESIDQELLEATLCHEFIHFLVLTDPQISGLINSDLARFSFFNEALTEMLTRQIYPNSASYEPQVQFQTFANFLTGNVNNYRQFLRGGVPGYLGSSNSNNMVSSASEFQKNPDIDICSMKDATANHGYQMAQKYLLDYFHESNGKTIADDYSIEAYLTLTASIKRLAPFKGAALDAFITKLDHTYITSFYPTHMHLLDETQYAYLLEQFNCFRNIANAKTTGHEVGNNGIIKLKINESRGNFISSINMVDGSPTHGMATQYNPNGAYSGSIVTEQYGKISFNVENNRVNFYNDEHVLIDSIDVSANRSLRPQVFAPGLEANLTTLKTLFTKKNVSALTTGRRIAEANPDISSIEQVKLLRSNSQVYIANHGDTFSVHNAGGRDVPLQMVGTANDLRAILYKGLTAKTNGAIWYEELGTIPESYIYEAEVYPGNPPVQVVVYFDGDHYRLAEGYSNGAIIMPRTTIYDRNQPSLNNDIIESAIQEHAVIR